MAVQRGLLLIADIAGYTRFMEFHRTDLAHAQDVVARLLEAMIDATSALDLVEVEGDAAFMYRPLPGGTGPELVESALGQSVAMHGAFHALQQKIACLNNCPCQGCAQVGNLKVKFVAHLGDVAPQRVKRLTRLAGFDVIFVHRMLKNRSEEHTSELQSPCNLVCRLLLEKKKRTTLHQEPVYIA